MPYEFGDRVIIKKDNVIGEIIKVEHDEDDYEKLLYCVMYPFKNTSSHWYYREEELELAPPLRYKVGDTVRIRRDLESGTRFGFHNVTKGMCSYAGTVCTIQSVHKDYYDLGMNNSCYAWTEEMFEPVVTEKSNIIYCKDCAFRENCKFTNEVMSDYDFCSLGELHPSKQLKPCPFCGGEAEFHCEFHMNPVIDENGAYVDAEPFYFEDVTCKSCGVRIISDENEEEGSTIRKWNSRSYIM